MSTFTDGSAIRHLQWLAVRSAMRLELKGLTHSRGSVIGKWKKHLGLKGNKQAIYDQFCALLVQEFGDDSTVPDCRLESDGGTR